MTEVEAGARPEKHVSVGIIGSGPVATGLSTLLTRAGHQVTVGTGHTGHPGKPALTKLEPGVVVATFAIGAEAEVVLVPRAVHEPGKWGAGYACDDPTAERVVTKLIRDSGYVPVRVGTLAASASIDVGGIFFARLLPAEHMRGLLAGVDRQAG